MFKTGFIIKLFLYLTFAVEWSDLNVIKVAIFAPEHPRERQFSIFKIRPALEIGREEVFRRQILPNTDLKLFFTDSNSSAVDAPIAAFELSNAGHSIFFGPIYDYALSPVARYCPKWNIPIVTVGGLSHSFRDNREDEYRTLTRAGASFDQTAEFLGVVLAQFKWKKFMLLYDSYAHQELFSNYGFLAGEAILNWRYNSDELSGDFRRLELIGKEAVEEILKDDISNTYSSKFGPDLILLTITTPTLTLSILVQTIYVSNDKFNAYSN
ncbi:hypothetical protein FSP39_012970 [Pinctada imbricata]|uniref:Receptor ligand binding region domain-containing protein n=1 Tax=Pinctada imbricata TaxID=66713 RepID=A0AA88YEV1_PINIB|nr:hypothetical protein FSP39_012970 [Pinctada imbricata]